MKTIEEAYLTYTSEVSSPEMTISLELALWLDEYCLKNQPHNILDLGSGFSTYIFARYKLLHSKVNITTFDTKQEYLDKTLSFIKSSLEFDIKLNTNITQYDLNAKDYELKIQQKKKYDLVLFDIAETEFRLKVLEATLKYSTQIIFDDWNSPRLREESLKLIPSVYSLTPLTELTDNFNRYPCLVSFFEPEKSTDQNQALKSR